MPEVANILVLIASRVLELCQYTAMSGNKSSTSKSIPKPQTHKTDHVTSIPITTFWKKTPLLQFVSRLTQTFSVHYLLFETKAKARNS